VKHGWEIPEAWLGNEMVIVQWGMNDMNGKPCLITMRLNHKKTLRKMVSKPLELGKILFRKKWWPHTYQLVDIMTGW